MEKLIETEFWNRNVTQNTQNLNDTESCTFFNTNFFYTKSETIQKMEIFWNREVSKIYTSHSDQNTTHLIAKLKSLF